jgi:glycosyltransferase involved in cell wall biosynthesis
MARGGWASGEGSVLLDCRWLGMGGAGRATELTLRALQHSEPAGRWILWGPEEASRFLWNGARHEAARSEPLSLWGQRGLRERPPHDVSLYFHQIRPFRDGRSVTLVHDTIPLRFGSGISRWLKRRYLRRVARISSVILTVSEYSRRCIERDLGAPGDRIRVIRYPVDEHLVTRVRHLRAESAHQDVALFVGRFAPHKNLERLVRAFGTTSFRAAGGRLLLVGGSPEEVQRMRARVGLREVSGVDVRGACSESDLHGLYATSRLLIMPSLEEGFGLPAWEAICSGLPVALSEGGALRELAPLAAATFPPASVEAMSAAIDQAATAPPPPPFTAPPETAMSGAIIDAVEAAAAGTPSVRNSL